jgi:hypothetical protein
MALVTNFDVTNLLDYALFPISFSHRLCLACTCMRSKAERRLQQAQACRQIKTAVLL